ITHEWVERSLFQSPTAPPAPIYPVEGSEADGTDIVFEWKVPQIAAPDTIADYHFELSDRADMAWPLSSHFEKLISNTMDRAKARYRVPHAGLVTPGQKYYWRVRARSDKGVWGPWSKTWSFSPSGPSHPTDVTLQSTPGNNGEMLLRWKPNSAGRTPVKY